MQTFPNLFPLLLSQPPSSLNKDTCLPIFSTHTQSLIINPDYYPFRALTRRVEKCCSPMEKNLVYFLSSRRSVFKSTRFNLNFDSKVETKKRLTIIIYNDIIHTEIYRNIYWNIVQNDLTSDYNNSFMNDSSLFKCNFLLH